MIVCDFVQKLAIDVTVSVLRMDGYSTAVTAK